MHSLVYGCSLGSGIIRATRGSKSEAETLSTARLYGAKMLSL